MPLRSEGQEALHKLLNRTDHNQSYIINRAILQLERLDAIQRAGNQLIIHPPDGPETLVIIL